MLHAPLSTKDGKRYLVTHSHEIERILHDIMDSKATVTIFGSNNRDFILSSIVDLDLENDSLSLEQGSSQESNEQLRRADHVTCVTTHDQVHIQFTGQDLKPALLGQERVFRVTVPKELLRLQRREFYRLGTSVINPVRCLIHTGRGFLETVVVDISIGGLGVLAYEGVGLLSSGEIHHGCRIALPGTGEFAVSLSVRSIFDLTLKNGRLTHRAGCQFIDLPSSVETEIQRYINRVERERRARYT